jgi:hypothetical protein
VAGLFSWQRTSILRGFYRGRLRVDALPSDKVIRISGLLWLILIAVVAWRGN